MCPSYFRIRLSRANALARYADWCKTPELEPPREISYSDAVTFAVDDRGNWRGAALYLYHNNGWTVFEDLSGHHSWIPAESWLKLAQSDDLVVAGYNDSICCGELTVIQRGEVVREFRFDQDDPESNVDRGRFDAG